MIAYLDTHRHALPEVKQYHGEKIYLVDGSLLVVECPTLVETVPLPDDAPEDAVPETRTYVGTYIYVPIINTDEITVEPCGPDCFAGHQDEKKYLN